MLRPKDLFVKMYSRQCMQNIEYRDRQLRALPEIQVCFQVVQQVLSRMEETGIDSWILGSHYRKLKKFKKIGIKQFCFYCLPVIPVQLCVMQNFIAISLSYISSGISI